MSVDFTVIDPDSKKVLYSGVCDVPKAVPGVVLEGIRVSSATHRVTADGTWVELKPQLFVQYSGTAILAGETVTITTPELVNIFVDDVLMAESVTELEILFEEAGVYKINLFPVLEMSLPAEQLITVT